MTATTKRTTTTKSPSSVKEWLKRRTEVDFFAAATTCHLENSYSVTYGPCWHTFAFATSKEKTFRCSHKQGRRKKSSFDLFSCKCMHEAFKCMSECVCMVCYSHLRSHDFCEARHNIYLLLLPVLIHPASDLTEMSGEREEVWLSALPLSLTSRADDLMIM